MKQFVIAGALACCGLSQAWSQAALTVGSPAIGPSSPVFAIGSTAIIAPTTSTASGTPTTVSLQALSDALVMLQTNLEQTLPVVSVFNDNFDFISLSDNGVSSTATENPTGNFGSNLATNLAVNLGVNAAMSTGPGLFNAAPGRPTTSLGAAPQGLSAVAFTRDTLRALLVLQNDIEHMLTVVNVLNSGTTNAGTFTNLFGVVR